MELLPINARPKESLFRANDDGLFNASSLAKEYGKDVYGYTRTQKVKDMVKDISLEYGLDPAQEFTDKGNIVRVISGGTTPGTWMHLDVFIKFLGWLNPKLERDFIKGAIETNKAASIDPHQEQLAKVEAEITTLKKKLSRNPFYKDLIRKKKEAKQIRKEIEKEQKNKRKTISSYIRPVTFPSKLPSGSFIYKTKPNRKNT